MKRHASHAAKPAAPRRSSAKAKWAGVIVLGSLVVLVVCMLGLYWLESRSSGARIGSETFALQIAKSQAERAKGLSGQPGLGSNEGMLFVFPTPGKPCMWMKDMQFNIDVLWLDASSKVVDQIQNVAPVTYPTEYCPESLSRYMIELPAGTIKRLDVSNGTVVTLPKL